MVGLVATVGWTKQAIWGLQEIVGCIFNYFLVFSGPSDWLKMCPYQYVPAAEHQVEGGSTWLFCPAPLSHANRFLLFQWDVSSHRTEYQIAFYYQEIASVPDGDPGGMTVCSASGDAPTVWENALCWGIRFSGSGVPYHLLHHRGLNGGHGWKPYTKRHCDRRRICPSCIHKSEPDNCSGGELCADWLQCHRRPVPQCSVVQLPRRPPGHGAEWWDWLHCYFKPCFLFSLSPALHVTQLELNWQQMQKRVRLI